MKDLYQNIGKFTGVYRGFVVWNDDPAVQGRLKIFVPGVFPDQYSQTPQKLPWAAPAMSPFGGNAPNEASDEILNVQTGWASPPHAGDISTGAQVFVFFENGNINYPVYFAFAQSKTGWLSEHPNQHVFKSDNVRIRIDENVKDQRSTCKFDSYNQNNSKIAKANLQRDCIKNDWQYDFDKGNIKQLQTRIDIEIKAPNINAVNLNIHGNVNMHIDGNWFVQHIGNKYQYHEGDTYIRQVGSTYVQQEGTVRHKLTGNLTKQHIGNFTLTHDGQTIQTHTGSYFMAIDGDVTYDFRAQYKLSIGKNYSQIIQMGKSSTIFGLIENNIAGDFRFVVGGNLFLSTEGSFENLIGQNFTSVSDRGNITLETKGNFQLVNQDNQITPDGFKNIGTRGNIQVISTFGNINLQCQKNDDIADFAKEYTVIPWNPSFITQIQKNMMVYPSFNKYTAIQAAQQFSTDADFGSVLKMLTQAFTTLMIYDGLPVFLPTKMIVQNPNTPIPIDSDDVSWIPKFRSQPLDWRTIDNSQYWKVPGKLMGNININTWSGDINISTKSELGCAGNINIHAQEKAGTLPGYKVGTVNISNKARKRIYPDPRDLFLQSDFTGKMAGQLSLFKHGTNLTDGFRRSVLPPAANSILQQTGFTFNWMATNYDKFYDLYGSQVVTNGSMGQLTSDDLSQMQSLKDGDKVRLGCSKCISDWLLGIPGIQDICYTTQDLEKFGSDGLHSYGFFKFNPFDQDSLTNPRGTFNISTGENDKVSIGDAHAIDDGFIDREFTGANIGAINISSDGDMNQMINRNHYMIQNASMEGKQKATSYVVTQKYLDDAWPSILQEGFKTLKSIWDSTFGVLITVDSGILKILGGLLELDLEIPFLDLPVPQNEFRIIGYTATSLEKFPNLSGYTFNKLEQQLDYILDFGFDFQKCKEYVVNPAKLQQLRIFYQKDYISNRNGESLVLSSDYQSSNRKTLCFDFKEQELFLSSDYSYFNERLFERNPQIKIGHDIFDLYWKVDYINSRQNTPDFYYKTTDDIYKQNGGSIIGSSNFISYRYYTWDKKSVVTSVTQPSATYTDHIENNLCYVPSTFYGGGDPRNIVIQNNYLAGRAISGSTIWTSPINTKTLYLNSVGYFHDEQNKKDISVNNISVKLSGNYDWSTSAEYKMFKENTVNFEAGGFLSSNIYINNGNQLSSFYNKIMINNGNDLDKCQLEGYSIKNQIAINNGNNTQESLNTYSIYNGSQTLSSENGYFIQNGSSASDAKNYFKQYNGISGNNSQSYYHITNGTAKGDSALSQFILLDHSNSNDSDGGGSFYQMVGTSGGNQIIEKSNSGFIQFNQLTTNVLGSPGKYTLNAVQIEINANTSYKLNSGSEGIQQITTGNSTYFANQLSYFQSAGTSIVGGSNTYIAGIAWANTINSQTFIGTLKGSATHAEWASKAVTQGGGDAPAKVTFEDPFVDKSKEAPQNKLANPEVEPYGPETAKTLLGIVSKYKELYKEYLKQQFKYLINIFKIFEKK